MNRRSFLKLMGQAVLAAAASATYGVAVEPHWLRIVRRPIRHPSLPKGLTLRIAMLADLHACYPWMPPQRIRQIVETTNAIAPDMTVLMGDYVTGHRFTSAQVPSDVWAGALGQLTAPLGVHAVLGNHDWWDDAAAMRTGDGPPLAQRALEQAGIGVLENRALRLSKSGHPFWLAGLGDQLAFHPWSRAGAGRWRGRDDLPGLLAQMPDNAPAILLAHEPDIFPRVPSRFALTLSGHTHGGQVRILGQSPVVPSRHGNRYAYGHVVEADAKGGRRDLVVSGGLGCSILPVRFGMPPEITLIEISGDAPAA